MQLDKWVWNIGKVGCYQCSNGTGYHEHYISLPGVKYMMWKGLYPKQIPVELPIWVVWGWILTFSHHFSGQPSKYNRLNNSSATVGPFLWSQSDTWGDLRVVGGSQYQRSHSSLTKPSTWLLCYSLHSEYQISLWGGLFQLGGLHNRQIAWVLGFQILQQIWWFVDIPPMPWALRQRIGLIQDNSLINLNPGPFSSREVWGVPLSSFLERHQLLVTHLWCLWEEGSLLQGVWEEPLMKKDLAHMIFEVLSILV